MLSVIRLSFRYEINRRPGSGDLLPAALPAQPGRLPGMEDQNIVQEFPARFFPPGQLSGREERGIKWEYLFRCAGSRYP